MSKKASKERASSLSFPAKTPSKLQFITLEAQEFGCLRFGWYEIHFSMRMRMGLLLMLHTTPKGKGHFYL
jgi:hypothetical protein